MTCIMFTAYIADQKSALVLPSHTPSVSASEPPVLKDRHRSFARARQMSKSSARKAFVSTTRIRTSPRTPENALPPRSNN